MYFRWYVILIKRMKPNNEGFEYPQEDIIFIINILLAIINLNDISNVTL